MTRSFLTEDLVESGGVVIQGGFEFPARDNPPVLFHHMDGGFQYNGSRKPFPIPFHPSDQKLGGSLSDKIQRLGDCIVAELQQRGVSPEDFQHPEYRQVFVSLSQSIPDAQGTAIASRLLSLPAPTANWEDCLQSFLAVLQRRRLRKIEEKLSLLENDREGFDVRMELYQLIKEYFDIYHEQSF